MSLEKTPKQENEVNLKLTISRIDPKNRDEVAAYYKFEMDHCFSQVPRETTFDKMITYRQEQMRSGKLKVICAKEGDQLVATSVVGLENGTMGKKLKDNEAWAAGTVVLSSKRSGGIGTIISEAQDKIAQEAGKNSLLTTIAADNYPSMRLRMKVGYRLNGVHKYNDGETQYFYRKDLTKELAEDNDYFEAVETGKLKVFRGAIDEKTPDKILVDPLDRALVHQAVSNNYEGRYLLRPEDFSDQPHIEKNYIVFVKKEQEDIKRTD